MDTCQPKVMDPCAESLKLPVQPRLGIITF